MTNKPLKQKLEIFQSENPKQREGKEEKHTLSPFSKLVGVWLAILGLALMIIFGTM